jgi:predicted O-methyltransferase YrrM
MVVLAPAALGAQAPDLRSDVPRDVAAVLRDIKRADTEMMAVSEEDGRFLRVMAVARGATSALEIGGASGYSAIWIGMAMRETGGRLTTIEFDPRRARELGDNIRRAGLADIVTVVHGDAFKVIPALQGSFDFVFLDAWKPDYKRFFELVLPRLRVGGVLLAHNTVNKRDEMQDFLDTVQTSPSVWTTFVSPSHEGMSVSVKR